MVPNLMFSTPEKQQLTFFAPVAYSSQTLRKVLNPDILGDRNVTSSAYAQCSSEMSCDILHLTLLIFSIVYQCLLQIVKGIIPSLFYSVFFTVIHFDTACSHLTLIVWMVYMNNNNINTIGEVSRFNNLLNNLQ